MVMQACVKPPSITWSKASCRVLSRRGWPTSHRSPVNGALIISINHHRQGFSTRSAATSIAPCKHPSQGWQRASSPCRQPVRLLHQLAKLDHRAFIALGSNLGDRIAMIEKALKLMQQDGSIRVVRTSSLWETKAMYVLDQDNFVNGACEVETSLSPMDLLDKLQSIENKMDRVKVIDKGPRNIDLDILLYDQEVVSNERLQIPHKLMLERYFVLRPLCEIIPNHTLPTQSSSPLGTLQSHLLNLGPLDDPISPLTPLTLPELRPSVPSLTTHNPFRTTQIMSIINVTPDSFSDGGENFNVESHSLENTIKAHIATGATILDIGGQSTRPHAVQISEPEELARVLPAVKLIRSMPEADNIAVSIDTYRASVAKEAIEAGADIVNDVSAGVMDLKMLSTVADLGCTVCLMHMRGTPATMSNLTSYPNGLIETIGQELLSRVQAAEAVGIKRWRIILDPGFGFAKTHEQNVELLRRLPELRYFPGLEGIPWLIGLSRKAFIGHYTGMALPNRRTWGTAACITAAIQGGADIVRVHDVQQMAETAKMADAIWRF